MKEGRRTKRMENDEKVEQRNDDKEKLSQEDVESLGGYLHSLYVRSK